MDYPRILLADDRPEVLEAIARLLEGEFEIVAAVEDGLRAIEEAHRLDPDVHVLDISMPTMNGLEAAFFLKGSGCTGRTIFLTVHEDRDFVEAAFAVGALGFVLKSHFATDLVPAIRTVLLGQAFISPSLKLTGMVSSDQLSRNQVINVNRGADP
jgi:DNA-binding NarL/FixJ family response regulator